MQIAIQRAAPRAALSLSLIVTIAVLALVSPFSRNVSAQPAPVQVAAATQLLEPFVVEIAGGLADSGGPGTSNPEFLINSDGDDDAFVITSILVRTNVPLNGFQALSVNNVRIDGTSFDTRTQSIVGFVDGTGVRPSADLMGMPVRTASLAVAEYFPGGNFPREIIAQNAGGNDVRVQMFARADVDDLDIEVVRVAGWKRASDTITLAYVPGS